MFVAATLAPARADFAPLWSLGTSNNEPSEFSSENGQIDAAPGSATLLDDDFYFPGTYPAPIGVVSAAEGVLNHERALTSGDPNNRYRFRLTASQASSSAMFRLTFRMVWGGWNGGTTFGTHNLRVTMNGQTIGTYIVNAEKTLLIVAPASAVLPVAGPNVIEISRTGGSASAWIQFDYLQLEVDPIALADADGDGLPRWWEVDNGLSDSVAADAAADSDLDGLTNTQEFQRGTNPWVADTDGDGLRDGVETNTGTFVSASNTGTNPLLADTDGDGLSDGAERALATPTNPLLIDTDGDGAPDAWEVRTGFLPTSGTSTPPAFPHAIGVKFVSDDAPGDALAAREITGQIPQQYWNNTIPLSTWNSPGGNIAMIDSPVAAKLVNSAGSQTTATISWTSDNTAISGNGGGTNQKLLNSYLAIYAGTSASVTLSAIPYATYDVYVYVGGNYDGAAGYVRLNDQPGSDRYFSSYSTRPTASFVEPIGSTQARPWDGNVIRFRNVSGASCDVKLFRASADYVGLHAVQIVNATADTDADGLRDWWEVLHQTKANLATDASEDIDADGLTNLQEFQRGTNPRIADTDGDGLSDAVETNTGNYFSATNTGSNPLIGDTDGDTINDGREVAMRPNPTNPNLADSDGDGRSDKDEIAQGTDPAVSTPTNSLMPVITTSPRTFTWALDGVQLVWDHTRGHVATGLYGSESFFVAGVRNTAGPEWEALRMGLLTLDGRITYFLFTQHEGGFSNPYDPNGDSWESDWNRPPADLRAGLGFSGFGRADISDPLRIELKATSTGAANAWNLTFSIRNLKAYPSNPTNDPAKNVVTRTFANCTAAPTIHDGTATWRNSDNQANRLTIEKHPGVEAFFRSNSIENLPAYAAIKDTDNDGMPDVWEDTYLFNKNSAVDANLDADGDSLTNLREYLSGTNPRVADSDGDGVNDGAEISGRSDPLASGSKPPFFKGLPAGISGQDLNGNGLPDSWELWVGSFALNANADLDGDGFNNAAESAAGTNPFDPKSRPWSSVGGQGNSVVLRWPRLSSKRHRVWQADALGGSWSLSSGSPSASGNDFLQTFPILPSQPLRYYRVAIDDLDTDSDGVSDWAEKNVLASNETVPASLRSDLPIDTNNDGAPDSMMRGDYVAYVERMQGGAAAGGFPGAGSGGGAGSVSRANAARFLTQATFGPTPAEIDRVQSLGYSGWITDQMAKVPTLHSTYIRGIVTDFGSQRIDLSYAYDEMNQSLHGNNFPTAFARAAIQGEDQLRQRVAFALSQILVASRRDANLEGRLLGMADYYDIFVRNAFGNYYDVLFQVAMHPCMGRYLSHVGNQKAKPEINQYPDENFAREVMQLFTIGLWKLNPDGTRQVNLQGQSIPTYSNTEITQFARVFTGLWFSGHHWGSGGWTNADYATPMTMHEDRHDFDAKILLDGFPLPARSASVENGMRDIADALRHLFQHQNTGPFISRQLIQFLITDNPSPAYVQRIGAVFANNGSGIRGDLGAVVRAILLDEEARDQRYPQNVASYGRLKEPVIRAMALGRAFGLQTTQGLLWWDWGNFYENSRQLPSYSPSVFNFYRPDYRAPGLLTQNQLSGPVFQITDSYSSIAFPNMLWELVENGFSLWNTYRFPLDLTANVSLAGSPEYLVDQLNTVFCGGSMTAHTRTIILNAINSIPADQPDARARVAAYLAAVAPEGAVMK